MSGVNTFFFPFPKYWYQEGVMFQRMSRTLRLT